MADYFKTPDAGITVLDVKTDTIAERTTAAGVTIDGVLCKDGVVTANLASDEFVKATCDGANATGGATTALLTVTLKRRDNTTAIASARQVVLFAGSAQYNQTPPAPNASLSLGTVTKGAVISGSQGTWLIETNSAGEFACTATNTDDETVYWSVVTPAAGVSDLTKACVVLGSNSDGSTWSA